jgi:branched-subunit amino acid ABC-type transport system permease component
MPSCSMPSAPPSSARRSRPLGRPNIPGTVLGVLLLGIVANGLLLTDLNFYWQQVGTGLLIFAVLASELHHRKAGARPRPDIKMQGNDI